MRCLRVSSFLPDVTQQIHSLRASGVISAHRLLAAASDSMALRKSEGSLWIVPPESALVGMRSQVLNRLSKIESARVWLSQAGQRLRYRTVIQAQVRPATNTVAISGAG